MSRGVILFAFNSAGFDYYKMAVATAKRVNYFLDLPVTVVTDDASISDYGYTFDKTIIVEPDKTNTKLKQVWINKGRFQAYDLSPYEETILLDTDYVINSNQLLSLFDFYDDFCLHDSVTYLMQPSPEHEMISSFSMRTAWATVVAFKKTQKVKQIFECVKMIQENFKFYGNIHGFVSSIFRNDFAFTFALRIVYGQLPDSRNTIPWNLLHVNYSNIWVYKKTDSEFNTKYDVVRDVLKNGKIKKEFITITDTDFHMINKENFMELIK